MILANRPVGIPEKNTWNYKEELISEIQDGQILIKHQYISLDPAMRGWMNNSKSYIPPVEIGTVMRAGTVGEVIKVKNNTNFNVGDFVSGWGGVQEYSISDGKNYNIINDKNNPIYRYLGALGMPGMTAYFGIIKEGKIKSGDEEGLEIEVKKTIGNKCPRCWKILESKCLRCEEASKEI